MNNTYMLDSLTRRDGQSLASPIAPQAEKPPPHLRPVKEPNPLWDRWLDG